MVFDGDRSALFCQPCSDALVLDHVGLSIQSGNAVFHRRGEVFGVNLRFREFHANDVLNLIVGQHAGGH